MEPITGCIRGGNNPPSIHSLANQEVLRWQMNMQKELGDNISHDNIKDFLWKTLKSGQVVPGYGNVPMNRVSYMANTCLTQLLPWCAQESRPALHGPPGVLRHAAGVAG